MRQMRTKLLTTTALAMGLLLPTAIVAQQSTEPAPSVQDQTTAPTGEQSATGADQSMGSQDLGQALTKLEIAQKRFEQAEGDSQSTDLEQARTDALDAINEIEQALQENPDQADDTKVSEARQAMDAAKEALEQEDRQPQEVAQAIGKLHDSVTGLQPMDQQQSSVDQPATGDQSQTGESGSSVTGEQQSALDQPATSGQDADQASRDPNVAQTGEAEVTVQKNDLPVNDADRAASAERPSAPADDTTAQAPDSSTAETSESAAPTPESDTAQTSEGTAPTPESDTAQTSESTAPTPPDTAQTTEPQQTAPGAETPQNQVAAMGSSLVGMELHGSDESSIGDIEEVVAGPDGQVTSVLIDVGGFLGIGSKRVAIDVNSLEMRGDRLVVIDMTEEQVEELPEHTQ
jgi:hypothetical protein